MLLGESPKHLTLEQAMTRPLRATARFISTSVLVGALAACGGADESLNDPTGSSSSGEGAGSGTSSGDVGGSGSGGGDSTPDDAVDFSFTPSNLAEVDVDAGGPDVELGTDCHETWIDTTSGQFACGLTVPFVTVDQGPGLPDITVFLVDSLHLHIGVDIAVKGSNALAIASKGDVLIEGRLFVRGFSRCGGDGVPGGFAGGSALSVQGDDGGGPGGGQGGLTRAGGGGANYGGHGGVGAESGDGAVGGEAGTSYGTDVLIPLLGGSGGGGGGDLDGKCGGSGGGAVLLASSTSGVVANSGGVNAGGRGGGWGGGGGSGGAILLEAPQVEVAGVVAANGGGGGGSHSCGCNGDWNGDPACGGDGAYADGGVGSSSVNADAGNGTVTTNHFACSGGGGGGAGRIRINTQSGSALLLGTVSPSPALGLTTEGTLEG